MIRVRATFAIAACAALAVAAPVAAQVGASCPLPLDQQLDSIRAFKPIASFLTSQPRCFNCHGGVNPFIDGIGPDPDEANLPAEARSPPSLTAHGGGKILRQRDKAPDGTALIEGECRDCHNNMPRRPDGNESLWMTAPSFLSFVGKDAPTLCKQIKGSTKTAEHFLGHLEDDNGGNQFGAAAFNGDRALDPDAYDFGTEPASGDIDPDLYIRVEPPSIPHAELMRMAHEWIAAMGGSFQGGDPCGCEIVELEGEFTQTQTSSQTAAIGTITHDYTVKGRLSFKRDETVAENLTAPSSGTEPSSRLLRPSAGEISVEINNESRGVGGGVCSVKGAQTFRIEDLPQEALQHLWIELGEEDRYTLSLGVISQYLLTPVELVCRIAGRTVRSSEMWDTAVSIGVQQGTLEDNGVVGKLDPPLRRGAATINGELSFGSSR